MENQGAWQLHVQQQLHLEQQQPPHNFAASAGDDNGGIRYASAPFWLSE
jgi:hypothetical protein